MVYDGEKYVWLKNTENLVITCYALDKITGEQVIVSIMPRIPKKVPEYYIYQDDFVAKMKPRNNKFPILKLVNRPANF